MVSVLVGLSIILPLFLTSYYHYLGSLALINIIVAMGLNILTGNAGQISMCQSSFMAVGAYGTTYMVTNMGISYWLALPLGGVIAALFGLALGFPALRIRGFYLAVVTLGFLVITQLVIEQLPGITGGVRGIRAPRPELFGIRISSDLAFYYVVLCVTLLCTWCAHSVLRSPTGRAFNAIRNSEAVAQTLAIPLARTKLIAFTIAAFYGGIGGGLFASVVGFIDPLEFGLWASIKYVVFIVVGGLGSVGGSIVGATVLTVLPETLREFQEYNELVFGIMLLFFLIVMPKGIVGISPFLRHLVSRNRNSPIFQREKS
jgi:branched-chain amino acid transport system permease protein